MSDSTNVERSGYTPSERAVIPRLHEIFSQTKKKLFFSCFSSSIHRIRLAMELAHQHGRKVAVVGRSLDNSTEIAQDLGYLDLPQGLVMNNWTIAAVTGNVLAGQATDCILTLNQALLPLTAEDKQRDDVHLATAQHTNQGFEGWCNCRYAKSSHIRDVIGFQQRIAGIGNGSIHDEQAQNTAQEYRLARR